jgi:hypothetical protein
MTVTSNNSEISDFGGGAATVSIPYTPAAGEDLNKIVIYYLSDSGELITIPDCVYDQASGTVVFSTKHFSTYVVGYHEVSFSDVSGWCRDYVNYLAARDIIKGTGGGAFSPGGSITRAQFAAILANMAGADLTEYTASSFSDVKASSWYLAPVEWAYKNGIVTGSGGKFNPNAKITREQMAVMLFNYAKYAGLDVSDRKGNAVGKFTDASSISTWAANPVNWAVEEGVISGNSDGSFAPAANATRAQAAKMVTVLLKI